MLPRPGWVLETRPHAGARRVYSQPDLHRHLLNGDQESSLLNDGCVKRRIDRLCRASDASHWRVHPEKRALPAPRGPMVPGGGQIGRAAVKGVERKNKHRCHAFDRVAPAGISRRMFRCFGHTSQEALVRSEGRGLTLDNGNPRALRAGRDALHRTDPMLTSRRLLVRQGLSKVPVLAADRSDSGCRRDQGIFFARQSVDWLVKVN